MSPVFVVVHFCLFGLWVSMPTVLNSWAVREASPDPGGLPRYPLRTIIPLTFALLTAQGISEGIKRWAFLAGWEGSGENADLPSSADDASPGEAPV